MKALLVLVSFFLFFSPSLALANVEDGILENKSQCLEVLLSEKYCSEAFKNGQETVTINSITRAAKEDAAAKGGNFADRIWLSEEMGSVAKGVSGQYNSLSISILAFSFLAAFVLLLFDWKNPWRRSHIDLLLLPLLLTISFLVYVQGNLSLSVFLNALFLLLLLLRMLFFSRGKSEGLRPSAPTWAFLIAIILIVPLHFLFALSWASVYDPGFSGLVGAKLLLAGEAIYGNFPPVVTGGDTYGPLNYYSYVPFQLLFPLEEILPFSFESLAVRWHALFFDLLTLVALFFIGKKLDRNKSQDKGNRLGLILVFAYLAFPISAFPLLGATNDSLPVFLMLLSFLFFLGAKPIWSGASLAAATMSKFMPGLLAPLFSRKEGQPLSATLPFLLSFSLFSLLLLLPSLLSSGVTQFWQETFYLQITRLSPHSFWGQLGGISSWPYTLLTLILALLAFHYPKNRQPALVAAFAAAILLAYQGSQMHWFYTYFVWSLPFMLIAFLAPFKKSGKNNIESHHDNKTEEKEKGNEILTPR